MEKRKNFSVCERCACDWQPTMLDREQRVLCLSCWNSDEQLRAEIKTLPEPVSQESTR